MRSANELTIRGAGLQLTRLLEALDRPLAGGWRRDAEAESRLRRLGLPGGSTHCFACTAEGRRPAAALWLQSRGDGELYVANIVPLGKRGLCDDESNLILADFDSQVLQPASGDPPIPGLPTSGLDGSSARARECRGETAIASDSCVLAGGGFRVRVARVLRAPGRRRARAALMVLRRTWLLSGCLSRCWRLR